MTETQCNQVIRLAGQLEQLISAKRTIQENPNAYLSIYYKPDFLCSYGNIKVLEFSSERLKIAEKWIDEDIQKLQEELESI